MTNFRYLVFIIVFLLKTGTTYPQNSSAKPALYYQGVKTYVNPVLPGDHPDPTLLKVGDDFYHCGSSFHFTPYLPIYHSKDLVHWEVISRVVPPSVAGNVSDRPSAGIWQGAITYFYGSFWIYFSSNGQWFCKANSPAGPWSVPKQVKTNAATGPLGYDNSIFVDDDGKPYMVIKNGQKVNRLQALGRDGQLADTVINLDWINARLQYSWAEGPVMCKRNGYYYYFPAGDVSGGQYVLRTRELTSDSTKWERLGNFFKPVTDASVAFRSPNHIAAPIQLADGSWWTLGQSYEKHGTDDWSGMGRQTSLYPVIWEGDRPWGAAPVSTPVESPHLPRSGILSRGTRSDYFENDSLGMCWHFLSQKAAGQYSLTVRKGWLRLLPDGTRSHLVQKETDHYYTAITRVDLDASDTASRAGIYLTNGNQQVVVRLYTGYENGKKIIFRFDTATRAVLNPSGNIAWLKLERKEHMLTGYYSADGRTWLPVGDPISAVNLDKAQPSFNSWVGTSVGLFAEGKPADFDFFICKDGFSTLPAAGYHNYYGVQTVKIVSEKAVTNNSPDGGWFMLSGVDFGNDNKMAAGINIVASSANAGKVEIWLDDISPGQLLATIPVTATGGQNNWAVFSQVIKKTSGQHDVFIKFPKGNQNTIYIKDVRLLAQDSGTYRNLFLEAGYSQAEIDKKIDKAYYDIFTGPGRVYFEVGDSMAYISDVKNHDARTEGLSYGMMIAVQLNKKEVFDRVWRWSKKYLQHQDGPREAYFAWSINPQTMKRNSEGSASDGELYYITSLLLAANRWGNNTGIHYYNEARRILDAMWKKDGTGNIYNLINVEHKQITFVPEGSSYNWTDPSYHLPAFYEIWALYAKDGHEPFYKECADTARAFLHRACDGVTGLNYDYADFSGLPHPTRWMPQQAFRYDSWRVPMNIAMDYAWFGKDKNWQEDYARRFQAFLRSKGMDSYEDQFNTDGSRPDFILQAGSVKKLRHSLGLVATAATASLMNRESNSIDFVRALWNARLEPYEDGYFDPYYDGLLYLFSLMHLSGKYHVIKP